MNYETIINELKDVTLLSTFVRLLLAGITGGIIGMERGKRRRAAGLRTFMLVCMGAALVMLTNQYIASEYGMSDPSRLGAQVISGIGFLGVGTIIVDRQQQVRGLTTAAGLWACACMGLAWGIGFYSGAFISCVFILLTIVILNKFEHRVISKSRMMEVYVEFNRHNEINQLIDALSNEKITISRLEIVQPRDYAGIDDLRAAALITFNLPKKSGCTEVMECLDSASGILLIEKLY